MAGKNGTWNGKVKIATVLSVAGLMAIVLIAAWNGSHNTGEAIGNVRADVQENASRIVNLEKHAVHQTECMEGVQSATAGQKEALESLDKQIDALGGRVESLHSKMDHTVSSVDRIIGKLEAD